MLQTQEIPQEAGAVTTHIGVHPDANGNKTPEEPEVYDFDLIDGSNVDSLMTTYGLRNGHSNYKVIDNPEAAKNWYDYVMDDEPKSAENQIEYCTTTIYGTTPKAVCVAWDEERTRVAGTVPLECNFIEDRQVKGLFSEEDRDPIVFEAQPVIIFAITKSKTFTLKN